MFEEIVAFNVTVTVDEYGQPSEALVKPIILQYGVGEFVSLEDEYGYTVGNTTEEDDLTVWMEGVLNA